MSLRWTVVKAGSAQTVSHACREHEIKGTGWGWTAWETKAMIYENLSYTQAYSLVGKRLFGGFSYQEDKWENKEVRISYDRPTHTYTVEFLT